MHNKKWHGKAWVHQIAVQDPLTESEKVLQADDEQEHISKEEQIIESA